MDKPVLVVEIAGGHLIGLASGLNGAVVHAAFSREARKGGNHHG